MNILATFFWIGLAMLLYTYFGYPLVLFGIQRFFSRADAEKESISLPTVSLLIAAYNEEKVIRSRLINCLAQDYSEDMLEVWVVSDGSSDRTNEIVMDYVNKYKQVHLIELPRRGKASALNSAMNYIESDIIVFSDANTEFKPDALRNLVRHFLNPEVGCVCGRLIYRNPDGGISGKGESLYWRYETVLKKMESRLGCVAGANGAIYAVRRGLLEPLPAGTVNDDFMVSMQVVKKGFKSIYEADAIAYEDVAPTPEAEFKRHVRDSAGHYIAVCHLLGLLNPFLGIRSFIYWSHRILRWCMPFILIFLFLINTMLLENEFYRDVFILQLVFYLWAVVGMFGIREGKLPFFFYIPFYFCNLNTALLIGFFKFLTGKQKMLWERTERV